jgi:glycerol-3-phosphate dehydrogenase
MKRERDLEALTRTTFDLAVIGGGIQGAATAREAALSGMRVALLEARDFGSGTSSRSSKLIHGGLRYLEQYAFRLVHEARRERRLLLKLAPHLARPVPFLLPIYRDDPYSPLKIRLGLTIYDLLGNLGRKDRHRMLDVGSAIETVPALQPQGLRAAAVYHDSQTDDARLTLETVLDAAGHGAVVLNYAEIRALVKAEGADSGGQQAMAGEVEDRLTGRRYQVAARFWVNAAGPWVDRVRALLEGYDGSKTVRLTKGTHLIIPAVTGRYALLAAVPPGDRVFLIVPWHNCALLGTTDTDFEGDPAAIQPDQTDTEYLLRAANRVLQRPLRSEDVAGSWAGLRALTIEPGSSRSSPSAMTREYRFHEDPWARNFVSICGGKLTTARALGEKLAGLVRARLLASRSPAGRHVTPNGLSSRSLALPGGQTGPFEVYVNYAAWEAVRLFDIPHPVAERIVRTYGSRWRKVLDRISADKSLAQPLPGSPMLLAAEVDFAIEEEMALTVEDFLLRRSGLSWTACMLREAVPAVADLFARRLGWSAERRGSAVEAFLGLAGC